MKHPSIHEIIVSLDEGSLIPENWDKVFIIFKGSLYKKDKRVAVVLQLGEITKTQVNGGIYVSFNYPSIHPVLAKKLFGVNPLQYIKPFTRYKVILPEYFGVLIYEEDYIALPWDEAKERIENYERDGVGDFPPPGEHKP